MRRQLLSLVPLVLIGLCIRSSLIGAEEKAEKEESARRLAEMKKTVERVELTIGKDGSDKLTRVEEPIQRWSNPLVRIVDATVFLWTRDGRPAVVAQVAEVTGEGVWQEFQSLTTEPLQGQRDGQSYWAPTAAGIQWMRAPTTEAPAGTAELRRIQMRKIAEKYRVSDLFEFKEPNQLRLLPAPLYRYSAPKVGVRDGALFSYALGTDPEVLLLVESQKQGDAETWMIAFARLTGFACQAALDDKEVWSCKLMPFPYPPDATFFSVRVAPASRGQ
ncbi:MAG: hypothetical protein IAG10_16910 [Planctomycetaceae bacterium]|nr:hypothetical protein [Planctomycetaceae bacterium]